MNNFLMFIFLFFIGSLSGWVIELIFRRFVHGKWVNPGFLVGPYLPIYGFGLCALTYCYMIFNNLNLSPIFVILLMGLFMTIIELIGGEFFLHTGGVKLWDYSTLKGNYKGIICPQFSVIWTIAGGLYYYLLAPLIIDAINWFTNNISFSFILGTFFGVIVIDFIYSTKLLVKIRKYAKENDIVVKYEELKLQIKERQDELKQKYSFIFAFKQTNPLLLALENYVKKDEEKIVNIIKEEKEKITEAIKEEQE